MIEVAGLTKIFGQRTAIQDLNFKVQAGEIVGFLGPNGAGKSTTMKIITAILPATSGTATVAGFDVFSQAMDVKKNIGYLPETPPVYFDMIVEDYLKYAARLHFVRGTKLKPAVDRALEKTGLTQVRHRLIGNLSKGYRQRVGIAQALVHDPKVLILDEPTVGLDPVQIIEVRQLIQSLQGAHTVILSSHILPEVTATCQRIIVINQGRIVAQDSIERRVIYQLIARSADAPALQALQAIPGVKSVQPGQSEGFAKVTIEIRPEQGEMRDRVLQVAMAQNMGVLEFSAEKLSLEQVFLNLTTPGAAS